MKISSVNSCNIFNKYHQNYKNLNKKYIKTKNNGQFLTNSQIKCQPIKPTEK